MSMNETNQFREIGLQEWRQFTDIHIKFDSQMTVLTGQNGTGKTTILNILSRHFGWNLSFISTPLPVSKKDARQLWSDFWKEVTCDLPSTSGGKSVGSISYTNDKMCKLMAPPHSSEAQYHLQYENQHEVAGLHIPSHRPAFAYHRVENIPTNPKDSHQQYQQYQQLLQQTYQSDHSRNPGTIMKQSLIAIAVFGFGTDAVVEIPAYRQMFEEFQNLLRELLPQSLGFRQLRIRIPDIVMVTDTGDFSLDAASGGIGAIVGLAWQIYMFGYDKSRFVVTIDEPESHLHPSMQRELLPGLVKCFPKAQFVVATHSPFIATSMPETGVYALTYNESSKVLSKVLDSSDLSGSANQTLRDILGVPVSVPLWVEDRLDKIVQKYRNAALTVELLQLLKKDLVDERLEFLLAESIDKLRGA